MISQQFISQMALLQEDVFHACRLAITDEGNRLLPIVSDWASDLAPDELSDAELHKRAFALAGFLGVLERMTNEYSSEMN